MNLSWQSEDTQQLRAQMLGRCASNAGHMLDRRCKGEVSSGSSHYHMEIGAHWASQDGQSPHCLIGFTKDVQSCTATRVGSRSCSSFLEPVWQGFSSNFYSNWKHFFYQAVENQTVSRLELFFCDLTRHRRGMELKKSIPSPCSVWQRGPRPFWPSQRRSVGAGRGQGQQRK